MKIKIQVASVKVMRSYDYCHFEVALSSSLDVAPGSAEWFGEVDNLRKNAARLADKAVEQYRVAKDARQDEESTLRRLEWEAELAERTPESDRTPEQNAAIKALADARFTQRRYDYQDDWNEDV